MREYGFPSNWLSVLGRKLLRWVVNGPEKTRVGGAGEPHARSAWVQNFGRDNQAAREPAETPNPDISHSN